MSLAQASLDAVSAEHPWQTYTAVVSSLPLFAVVGSILYLELQRSKVGVAFVSRIVPELAGLAVLGTTACLLLWLAGHNGFGVIPESHAETWDSINREWPLLTSADSLFVLQGMMRLVVTCSAAFRAGSEVSPLAGSPAAFLLLAVASRLTLISMSPVDVYHIDGPLGGATSVLIEWAAVLPLIILCRSLAYSGISGVLKVLVGTAVAVVVAANNQFDLAPTEYAYLDTLFSLVQVLDFLAALCVLLRYMSGCLAFAAGTPAEKNPLPRSPSTGLAFMLLPVQQLLPAYFFLCAFAPPLEVIASLVRSGRPFELMWLVGFAQVGMYILAGALHLALSDAGADNGALPQDAMLLPV